MSMDKPLLESVKKMLFGRIEKESYLFIDCELE